MSTYNSKSLIAEEFISDTEIQATLAYAQENKHNRELIEQILAKGATYAGLSYKEAAVLLECDLPDIVERIYKLANEIKLKIYGRRIVMFAPLYLSLSRHQQKHRPQKTHPRGDHARGYRPTRHGTQTSGTGNR